MSSGSSEVDCDIPRDNHHAAQTAKIWLRRNGSAMPGTRCQPEENIPTDGIEATPFGPRKLPAGGYQGIGSRHERGPRAQSAMRHRGRWPCARVRRRANRSDDAKLEPRSAFRYGLTGSESGKADRAELLNPLDSNSTGRRRRPRDARGRRVDDVTFHAFAMGVHGRGVAHLPKLLRGRWVLGVAAHEPIERHRLSTVRRWLSL